MGTAPPYSSSSSSSSQMAASKGKGVVHPPACVVIMRTHARSACSRFSFRAVDLPRAGAQLPVLLNIGVIVA